MTAPNQLEDLREQREVHATDESRRETSSHQPNLERHSSSGPSQSSGRSPASAALKRELRSIDLNVMFDVLKNRRRRRAIEFLHEQEGQTTLSVMAEYLAAIENDKPRRLLSSQERKRVYIGLYQFHLPRMDQAGIIEFDRNRGTIKGCEKLAAYRPYSGRDRPYPTFRTAPALLPSTTVLSGSALIAALIVTDVPGWITDGVLLVALSFVLLLTLVSIVSDRRLESTPI